MGEEMNSEMWELKRMQEKAYPNESVQKRDGG